MAKHTLNSTWSDDTLSILYWYVDTMCYAILLNDQCFIPFLYNVLYNVLYHV